MSDNAIGPIFNPPVKSTILYNYKFDNCSRLGFHHNLPFWDFHFKTDSDETANEKRANYKASYIQIIYCFLPKKKAEKEKYFAG